MKRPTFLHECRARPRFGYESNHGLQFADGYAFVDAGFGECVRVDMVEACCFDGKSGFEWAHLLKSFNGAESYGVRA